MGKRMTPNVTQMDTKGMNKVSLKLRTQEEIKLFSL